MGLTEYERKRHFAKTPEPAAETGRDTGWRYVIQKHDATRLHYDFRLELDNVLKSWAVPKGPSLDPSIKRLAVEVEDHPVAYGTFEGIIPPGEYGGGTVLLWDTGEWEPVGDPHENLRNGKLKFILHGEKLRGGWTLVRTRSSNPAPHSVQWLLIKERDEEARGADEGDIVEELPLSTASGRDLDGIASAKDRIWSSKEKQKKGPVPPKAIAQSRTTVKQSASHKVAIAGGIKQALPGKVEVQLATLTQNPPEGEEWFHEIKFDGYRMVCRIDQSKVKFITRNQQDWTDRLKPMISAVQRMPVKQAILDGEVVALQPDGTTDFQSLQNAFRDGRAEALKYYVFDLLYLNGKSLLEVPLEERKRALRSLLDQSGPNDVVLFSDHVTGAGEDFKRQACTLHLEGMISKRRDQPYRAGRGYDWLKTKCLQNDEFVIGGFTEPKGSRVGFGAVLVGFHDAKGDLHYGGKVGTGFDDAALKELSEHFQLLEQSQSPFVDVERKTGDVRTAHWLKPSLVGQFNYGSRTREGRLRHASFLGLREDKPADQVQLDLPVPVEQAVKKTGPVAAGRRMETISVSRRGSRSTKSAQASTARASDADGQIFAGIRLTHPEKILYPDVGVTKLELAQYLQSVAGRILPYLQHRPLVIVRCPDGQGQACFYQKHPGIGTPSNLRQISIAEKKKTERYLVVDDAEGLIALAQIAALELHAWGSREDKLEQPDRLIFDLDPAPEVPWKRVVDGARQVREFLQDLGLESFVKTTGGKGLHLVVPIDRRHNWDEAKEFCKTVAEAIERAAPGKYTSNMSKAARTDKIFIDYLRNGRGATAIVPYSMRARENATVSVPLAWKELSPKLHSDQFTIRNVLRRLKSLAHDPWSEFGSTRQTLTGPIRKLKAVSAGQ